MHLNLYRKTEADDMVNRTVSSQSLQADVHRIEAELGRAAQRRRRGATMKTVVNRIALASGLILAVAGFIDAIILLGAATAVHCPAGTFHTCARFDVEAAAKVPSLLGLTFSMFLVFVCLLVPCAILYRIVVLALQHVRNRRRRHRTENLQ